MKEEEQKQVEIARINDEQKAVRAEQERQEIERAERAETDRREEQKELDRKEADRKEQDDKYYREKAEREQVEADRREERKEQERNRQEPKPNPIKEKRQVVEYFEHWQDVKSDKQTEANRNYIYAQYAISIERTETPQQLKEELKKAGIEMKRSEQDPRVYEYHYKDTKAESLSYMTDKKVYSNRPQEITETIKKIETPKKQLQR